MYSDAHCDTITRVLDKNQSLLENDGHVDIKRLIKIECGMQFFAVWIDPKYEPYMALPRAIDAIDKLYTEANALDLHVIKNANDVDFALSNKKIGALISIEGGSAIGGRLSSLRMLHRLGVRAMTLTWNGRNEIADGIGEGENAGGLSLFGLDVISEMNRLNMIIDVSHLSKKGFWDVAEISSEPFIASHSNAKALCPHRRNLDDEQIKCIIEKGGFIGINFCSDFLNEKGADAEDIVNHIDYILSLGGENVLGFGADFDGVDDLPNGIKGAENIETIIELLVKKNYKSATINKILYRNLHNVVKQILKN